MVPFNLREIEREREREREEGGRDRNGGKKNSLCEKWFEDNSPKTFKGLNLRSEKDKEDMTLDLSKITIWKSCIQLISNCVSTLKIAKINLAYSIKLN